MAEDSKELLEKALGWLDQGRRVALVTVVATSGSVPRPVGSVLVVEHTGQFAGSVSGGCIEGAAVSEALETLESGQTAALTYGISDSDALHLGLACGGEIRLHVGPVTAPDLLRRVIANPPAALVTRLDSGLSAVVDAGEHQGPLALSATTLAQVRQALDSGQSRLLETPPQHPLFVHVFDQPDKLLVIGAGHISHHLVPLARQVGFEVTVIEPRRAFARGWSEASTPVIVSSTAQALKQTLITPRTAVVALAHDAKIDNPALVGALRARAFYVGALGSTRTHKKRCQTLREMGLAEDAIARIRGPIGLDIGARSPGEIAISIVAEVIAARHGKDPRARQA